MKIKDLIKLLNEDQSIYIKNQYNDDTYDGVVSEIEKNEYDDKILNAEVLRVYTSTIDPNYIFIESKEEEDE